MAAVRLIVARREVVYTGRLTAVLPEALRLLMLKSDGSVMVHADTGGFKPQNLRVDLVAGKLRVNSPLARMQRRRRSTWSRGGAGCPRPTCLFGCQGGEISVQRLEFCDAA